MTLGNTTTRFILDKVVVKRLPGRVIIIQSRVVCSNGLELFHFLFIRLDVLSHTAEVIFMSHLGTSITNNVRVFRQEPITEKFEKGGIGLFLCKVTRGTQYYFIRNMSVITHTTTMRFLSFSTGIARSSQSQKDASVHREKGMGHLPMIVTKPASSLETCAWISWAGVGIVVVVVLEQ